MAVGEESERWLAGGSALKHLLAVLLQARLHLIRQAHGQTAPTSQLVEAAQKGWVSQLVLAVEQLLFVMVAQQAYFEVAVHQVGVVSQVGVAHQV